MEQQDIEKNIRSIMTIEISDRIFKLRCIDGYTWRAVASQIDHDFPGVFGFVPLSDKLDHFGRRSIGQNAGIALCSVAMELRGESISDGWN